MNDKNWASMIETQRLDLIERNIVDLNDVAQALLKSTGTLSSSADNVAQMQTIKSASGYHEIKLRYIENFLKLKFEDYKTHHEYIEERK